MIAAESDSRDSNNINNSNSTDTNNPPPKPNEHDNNNNGGSFSSSSIRGIGDKVDRSIYAFFHTIGHFCSRRPILTISLSLMIAIACSAGMVKLNTENRPEKLWVPQNTMAEMEGELFEGYFPPTSRFESVIVSAGSGGNVLTKENLISVMRMHEEIESGVSVYEGQSYTLTDLCTPAGTACYNFDFTDPICRCLLLSILKLWNYDLSLLEAESSDDSVLETIHKYGSRKDLEGVLGNPKFDETTGQLLSAEALSISYFLEDRSKVANGNEVDPINEEWENTVFLTTVQSYAESDAQNSTGNSSSNIKVSYLSSRSFSDEFGGEITGDLVFVQVSYIVAFLFLGASMGSKVCGRGSRWSMAFSSLILVAMATTAGFGIASLFGLLYGPVHSILPFVLLGIGVDDSFVIANAFDREREGIARDSEDDVSLIRRGARALARAGASITVTSATDLVAFAISSTSALPALGSFCAFASINIFFLWALSATFFTATMVLDEKRQRDNRRDVLCCITRKKSVDNDTDNDAANEVEDSGSKEGFLSRYFRNHHAPAVLSKPGKILVLLFFSGLFAFGLFGLIKLPVENSERNFIPVDSYIKTYAADSDVYFPSDGARLFITFENGREIYDRREELADLSERVSGFSEEPPYIAEPGSDSTYQNVMTGLKSFLSNNGTSVIGNAALGQDNWPTNYEDFVTTLRKFASFTGPGAVYAQDLAFSSDGTDDLVACRVAFKYVKLTKTYRGEILDDAERQVAAMDETREMVDSWTDLPPAFPYSEAFIGIEGFKIIREELYRNVGLAIAAVGVIVLVTVANVVAAFLITINVAFCIVEILGFMYALGLVIDSVSVINIVLAVGLSIDYSAHIGHCFMVKGGNSKDDRATEALADIGASVLNGALSTFLAVAVLLGSSSYVFKTLSIQFALTVALGVLHGLVLLPVLLSLFGPRPFSSAEKTKLDGIEMGTEKVPAKTEHAESFGENRPTNDEENYAMNECKE